MQLDGSWIAIDASCPSLQVALFQEGKLIDQTQTPTAAMEGLLHNIEQLCRRNHHPISETSGFIYGSGPGSILGIRLSLMAIRTWTTLHRIPTTKVMHCRSLAMAAAQYRETSNTSKVTPFLVCSEWKKDHWNCLIAEGPLNLQPIKVRSTEQLIAYEGTKLLVSQRKLWTEPPASLQPVKYAFELLANARMRAELLHPVTDWEIYSPDESAYARWSGDRHRAP